MAQVAVEEVTDDEKVVANVADRICKAGLDTKRALRLAEQGADVRVVERLAAAGCPHDLIERIVL